MLALDVTHLTNKLQKQTLEENSGSTSNIKLINPDSGYKLSEATQVKLKTGGNNVWRVSLRQDSEEKSDVDLNGEFVTPSAPKTSAVTKVLCSHKKLIDSCSLCESLISPTVPNERPKKRNSQSISVPQECEINSPPAKSSWQPQGSRLWKPIVGRYGSTSPYSSVAMGTGRSCHRLSVEEKWDSRQNQWSPTDYKNYVFSSLAPSVQRHMETGHITPDDLLTPPESPVPRPNSVYSDGAISPFYSQVDFTFNRGTSHFIQEFRNRSLSVEDKISCSTLTCFGTSNNSTPLNHSVPSSPHHRKVPRCRSQPSFYDRKSGRRRRRDLRPTLNFNKMTETAYGMTKRVESRSDNVDNKERMETQWQGSRFRTELENAMGLMPIASSPRDTDLSVYPNVPSQDKTGPIHELESTSCDNTSSVPGADDTMNSGPVKLLGDDDQDETDMEVFQLTEELDLEQIENDRD
ncbi:protein import into nucleus [Mactra antiquata]